MAWGVKPAILLLFRRLYPKMGGLVKKITVVACAEQLTSKDAI